MFSLWFEVLSVSDSKLVWTDFEWPLYSSCSHYIAVTCSKMHTLVDCTQYLQDQNDHYKWEGEYGQNYSTAILVKLTNHCMNSYRELCPKHHHTAPEVTKKCSHSTWYFNNEGMIILTEANGHGEIQQSGQSGAVSHTQLWLNFRHNSAYTLY